jgi:hypothetical protein
VAERLAATAGALALTADQLDTLDSLQQIGDYPLYTMTYKGAYDPPLVSAGLAPDIACSLFAALGNPDHRLLGRNFDWDYTPALILFTDPPDAYASVSMVDLTILFGADAVQHVRDLPLSTKRKLLDTPQFPYDGMNEHGLAIGMAAVPQSPLPAPAGRPQTHSVGIIRHMLDRARTVEEAIEVMEDYSITWEGGPPIHYLLADRSGNAALVEYYQGQMVVIRNEAPWHLATNHLRAAGPQPCWRYDRIEDKLLRTAGNLSSPDALDLLAEVSQGHTQWSIVYGLTTSRIDLVMGRDWSDVKSLHLP